MNNRLEGLSRQYQAALRNHLKQGSQARMKPAQVLGRRALAFGLETLDLARVHEKALMTLGLTGNSSGARNGEGRRAGAFFAEAITAIEETHRGALEANVHLNQMLAKLSQRSTELANSNRHLKKEIKEREVVEAALRKSEQHYSLLLRQSSHLQEQLRHLSRQLLSAQEEERKMISRELHDEVAQTLTGINIRLAALKAEAKVSTRGLQKKITSTQRMVEKSVSIVHRFARELRPTVLDDLGLIPALNSFANSFAKRTRILVQLKVFAEVELLESAKRTVLYRVAQEALTNVANHARATQVEVTIRKLRTTVRMEIKDNGKSFHVERVLHARRNNRLGLIGMRERVEMVGGSFTIESAKGKGTIVRAELPLGKRGGMRRTLVKFPPRLTLNNDETHYCPPG